MNSKKETKIKEENKRKPLKVIHSSTPLRINDIGGWTDTWFSGEGKVLNFAVAPRVEVRIQVFSNIKKRPERVLVRAKNYGDTFRLNPEKHHYDQHPLLQGAINSMAIPQNLEIEISLRSPIPVGSSTGTSASVCVALLGALDFLTLQKHSRDEIVTLAHRVETDKLEQQSGIQDQICAAYGGICFIHMYSYPQSHVSKLELEENVREELDRRLCLIYLGKAHSSSALHEEVIATLERKGSQFGMIRKLRNLAQQAQQTLLKGDLAALGEVMIQNNECQRALHSQLISEEADSVIEIAKKYKAAGWKVNGAGGKGGSLTILGSEENSMIAKMIEDINLLRKGIKHLPISLSKTGLKVWEEGETKKDFS